MTVRFVASTRASADEFFANSLLALSLENLAPSFAFSLEPAFAATSGLAAVYNPVIERAADDDLIVFVHDDVQIEDWNCGARLVEALAHYDVIGVAGTRTRKAGQATWFGGEPTELSGSVKHIKVRNRKYLARFIESGLAHLPAGRGDWQARWTRHEDGSFTRKPPVWKNGKVRWEHPGSGHGKLDFFGESPAPAKLVDGVFIAARADRLRASKVRFDPQFSYHLYDLDFCRQCEVEGLNLGVWPIAIAHGSTGGWSESWRKSSELYLAKWGQ